VQRQQDSSLPSSSSNTVRSNNKPMKELDGQKNSNPQANTLLSSASDSLYDEEFFVQTLEDNGCIVAEHVCIPSTQDKPWFYYNPNPHNQPKRHPHQPELALFTTWKSAPPYWINITHHNSTFTTLSQKCQQPPTLLSPQNHIFVTALYIHMIMEFYLRVTYGIWDIFQKGIKQQHNSAVATILPAVSQFYIHYQKDKKQLGETFQLLPGMHPLMKTVSDWPLKSLQDIVNITSGNTITSKCPVCMSRVVFCGYKEMEEKHVQWHPDVFSTKDTTTTLSRLQQQHDQVLVPGGHVGLPGKYNTKDWHGLRQEIISRVVHNSEDTLLQQEIRSFKIHSLQEVLQQHHPPHWTSQQLQQELDNLANSNDTVLDQYTMIGLSQRASRRWLNLEEIQDQCNQAFFVPYKIACIEVNFDKVLHGNNGDGKTPTHHYKIQHPYQDVVLHANLDVLIGIHGSHLANVVYMPPNAYVLELLPYVYNYFGRVFSSVRGATPVGFTFSETSLRHMGHPLGLSSSADCHGRYAHVVPPCVNATSWLTNDFVLPWWVLNNFVHTFLVATENNTTTSTTKHQEQNPMPAASKVPRSCDFFDQRANLDFVIYSVPCQATIGDSSPMEYRHYYRERRTFEHLKNDSFNMEIYD
jgi:hypothetical protein